MTSATQQKMLQHTPWASSKRTLSMFANHMLSLQTLRPRDNPGTEEFPQNRKIVHPHTTSGMGMNLGTQVITL